MQETSRPFPGTADPSKSLSPTVIFSKSLYSYTLMYNSCMGFLEFLGFLKLLGFLEFLGWLDSGEIGT